MDQTVTAIYSCIIPALWPKCIVLNIPALWPNCIMTKLQHDQTALWPNCIMTKQQCNEADYDQNAQNDQTVNEQKYQFAEMTTLYIKITKCIRH